MDIIFEENIVQVLSNLNKNKKIQCVFKSSLAQSAGAVEYTDCTSSEG